MLPHEHNSLSLQACKAIIKSPTNCTSTLKTVDNRIIDYCVVSQQIAHLVNIEIAHEGPWSPHHALTFQIQRPPL